LLAIESSCAFGHPRRGSIAS